MLKRIHLLLAAILCVSSATPTFSQEKPLAKTLRELSPLAGTIAGTLIAIQKISAANEYAPTEAKVIGGFLGGCVGFVAGALIGIIIPNTITETLYESQQLLDVTAKRYNKIFELLKTTQSPEEFAQQIHGLYPLDTHPCAELYDSLSRKHSKISTHLINLNKYIDCCEKTAYGYHDLIIVRDEITFLLDQITKSMKIVMNAPCYQHESAAYMQEQLIHMQRQIANLKDELRYRQYYHPVYQPIYITTYRTY